MLQAHRWEGQLVKNILDFLYPWGHDSVRESAPWGQLKNFLIYSVISESHVAESLHPGLDVPAKHNVLP
jgi:hypothetical protein